MKLKRATLLLVVVCFFSFLALPLLAQAKDLMLKWDPDPVATGYKVYETIDQGVTWTVIADVTVTQAVVTANPAVTDGLILYRVSAYNANGETIRTESGIWYQPAWEPPQVQNVGVQ